jgi:hypothetical protein
LGNCGSDWKGWPHSHHSRSRLGAFSTERMDEGCGYRNGASLPSCQQRWQSLGQLHSLTVQSPQERFKSL